MLLLLVLLSLDLLVFFSGQTSSLDRTDRWIEAGAEMGCYFFSESEECCEEEETDGFGIPSPQITVACALNYSERLFFSPDSSAYSVAIGWKMPLLI